MRHREVRLQLGSREEQQRIPMEPASAPSPEVRVSNRPAQSPQREEGEGLSLDVRGLEVRPPGGAQGPGERLPQLPNPQRPLPLAVVQEQAWSKTLFHPDRCGPRQGQDDSPSNLRLGQAEGAGILPARSHVLCATVSKRAGRWFVSIGVRKKRVRVPENNDGPVAGVDWGIIHPATVSDGTTLEKPRLERLKWQERHAQKALTRKAKGSKNRLKALLRHQKIWYRITNIRVDRLHKFTTTLARTKSVVVVEDLAASNMARNHSLAGAIYAGAPYEMRRQLEYKAKWYGSRLIVAPRNYPSTKMCSRCGAISDDISLGERTYHCATCGLVVDRDLNAAINLANCYCRYYGTASSAGRACQMQEVTSPQGL